MHQYGILPGNGIGHVGITQDESQIAHPVTQVFGNSRCKPIENLTGIQLGERGINNYINRFFIGLIFIKRVKGNVLKKINTRATEL